MPITILDYVKSVVGEKDCYPAEDFSRLGVAIVGGCEGCTATIAAYNAYPSTSGYWRCADCINDTGFATVEEYVHHTAQTSRAVNWLLRLRQLQADGMDFDAALAQANAEAELDPDTQLSVCDPKADESTYYLAPADDPGELLVNC